MLWNGFLHHVLVHTAAVHCCLMCFVGLSELHRVHRGLYFVVLLLFFIVCCFPCVLFGVMHWSALWNSLLHHVFVHLVALQFIALCLLGLSDLQFVHRGVVCLLFCCSLFVVSCLSGVMMISVMLFHVLFSC